MGENIYMSPGNMNLNIKTGTAGYNNKILVSDGKIDLGKNDKVNALELAVPQKVTKISHRVVAQPTTRTSYHSQRGKSCLDTFSCSWFCDMHMFQ